jgi:hypothetical protein
MGERCSWWVDKETARGVHVGNERCGTYSDTGTWDEHRRLHLGVHIVGIDHEPADPFDLGPSPTFDVGGQVSR